MLLSCLLLSGLNVIYVHVYLLNGFQFAFERFLFYLSTDSAFPYVNRFYRIENSLVRFSYSLTKLVAT